VLKWDTQAIPGDDIEQFQKALSEDWFTAGSDAAEDLDIPGARERRRSSGDAGEWLGDDDEPFIVIFEYNEITVLFNESTEEQQIDPMLLFSVLESDADWSGLDFSGMDLSGRDFGRANLTQTNFSGTNLSGANLSGALLVFSNLRGANLSGADLSGAAILTTDPQNPMQNLLQGSDLSGADLSGAWGLYTLLASNTTNTTCPDGTTANTSGCQIIPYIPAEILALLDGGLDFEVQTLTRNATLRYAGKHIWVPGLSTGEADQAIVIGESTWRTLIGANSSVEVEQTRWFFDIGTLADEQDGDVLRRIRVAFEADSRVSSATDWSTEHRDVERNGGMIFGTPGLLSLQFLVAALASIASAFVFLSLVLTQRKKDLAILQAIGASPNQVIRLTLFEILSIVLVSMVLGIILGIGISWAFNGFFSIFGFIFQIFGGSSTPIDRDLVWPWWELLLVNGSVMIVVVLALFFTTRRALKADLATVLKGE
jgi:hypothetical protein